MPKVSPIQSDFSGGEFGPRLEGRVDLDRYRTALKTCKNYVPTLQGDLINRPGSIFIGEVKDSSKAVRLIPFEFNVQQAYILEFGDEYIRFFRDGGQITTGGNPVEISSPYQEADLFAIRYVQSADVLYLVHPDYETRTLSRVSDTSWSLSILTFIDGPYLDLNTTATTLTPSTTGGTAVITASSTVGINGGDGFQSTDVGRLVRIENSAGAFGYGAITVVTSTTEVSIAVTETLPLTSATGFWRLGLISETTGYPSVVGFHENRLLVSGIAQFTQRVALSETGFFESFTPVEADGSVLDTNSISFDLNANDVNAVRWALSDEKGLVMGTVGGEWIVRPSNRGEALTPGNVSAKRSTTYGSAEVKPEQVGKSGLFVQRAGKKIRELSYYFDVDGFRAPDLTLLNEEITGTGVKEIAQQKVPQPILWVAREDGALVGLTYERDLDSFKAGWHRHEIGGTSNAGVAPTKIESVAVIPTSDARAEELWFVAQRYVDGGVVRYVESLTQFFDDFTEQRDAFFVDSGLKYDMPVDITAITKDNPGVVTATAHGFSNGDKVLIDGVQGMIELNTNSYLVANATTDTFELQDLQGNDVDTTGFTVYVSGGEVRKFVSTISGLDHLEGESVTILANGAVQPNKTVESGEITLSASATTVIIGLGYNSDAKLLRFNAGSADGTALGKTRRTHRVGVLLHRSLGLNLGPKFSELTELTFRTAADELSRAPALFTGIISETFEADYDFENEICIRQSQPLPSNILAVMPQMNTQDR